MNFSAESSILLVLDFFNRDGKACYPNLNICKMQMNEHFVTGAIFFNSSYLHKSNKKSISDAKSQEKYMLALFMLIPMQMLDCSEVQTWAICCVLFCNPVAM